MEAIAFGKFQHAAAAAATFELRVRLLAEQATPGSPVEKSSLSSDLTPLIADVADYFEATADEKKYLKSAAVIRNKLLHLELSRVTGRVVPLQQQLVDEGLLPAKIDQGKVWSFELEKGGEVVRVDKTSTEQGGIYGWMLEAALSGTFEAVVAVMLTAMKIVERLRDAHIAKKLAAITQAEREPEAK